MSDIVARAEALVGAKFRPQGRDAATGLDCLGLVYAATDVRDPPRPDYRLRGEHAGRILGEGQRWFRRVARTRARAGDVLLLQSGPRQLHLAILTKKTFIHADAAIGQVVKTPGQPRWPVRAVLRRRVRPPIKEV